MLIPKTAPGGQQVQAKCLQSPDHDGNNIISTDGAHVIRIRIKFSTDLQPYGKKHRSTKTLTANNQAKYIVIYLYE